MGSAEEQGTEDAGITVTDVLDGTGTATSPLDALVEGLQDLHGSNPNDSFRNETTANLHQD